MFKKNKINGLKIHLKINYSKFRIFKSNLFIFLYYLIIVLIWTYPIVLNLGSQLLGYHDAWQFVWNFWWVKTALVQLQISPFYTNYIHWPGGISLLFHTLTLSNSLIAIPLQYVFKLTTTYNLLIILNFAFNGLATYLLAYNFTKNKFASFIAGYIVAFSPYMFAHALGHLNLMSFGWVPLAILYFYKMVKGEAKWYLPSLFIILAGLSDWYYFFYLMIFLILYLIFLLFTDKKIYLNKSFIRNLLLAIFTSLLILSPYLGYMIYYYVAKNDFNVSIHDPLNYSVDLLAFLIPNASSYFRDHFMQFWRNWHWTWEGIGYLGYSLIFLVLYGILKIRNKAIFFWAIIALLFGLLSLGPFLQVNGKILHFPLPYYWLQKYLPFMSVQGVPARFASMVYLSFAVIAAITISYILKTKTKLKMAILVFLIILLVVEYLPKKLIISPIPIPDFYVSLQNDHNDYAILDTSVEESQVQFYQTIHHKRLIGGYTSRPSQKSLNFLKETPVISNIYHSLDNPDIGQSKESSKDILKQYQIKYIMINQKDKARITILQKLELPVVWQSSRILVYQVY